MAPPSGKLDEETWTGKGLLFTNLAWPLNMTLLLNAISDPKLFENVIFYPELYPLNSESYKNITP